MRTNTKEILRVFDEYAESEIGILIEQAANVCRQGLKIAHEHRGAAGKPRIYQHHTHNLANAPGYCIVIEGRIVKMEIFGDSAYPEAKRNTENYLIYNPKDQYGIYIADGMHYASFVSAKGFDVLDSCRAYLEKNL